MIVLQTQEGINPIAMLLASAIWIWLLTVSYKQGAKRKIGSTWAVIAFIFLSWIGLIIIFTSKKITNE